MSSYFDDSLDTKLKELTDQLSDFQHLKKNKSIKNLDYDYQTELIKENKKKEKKMLEEKKIKKLENREVNFFEISLKELYINFINTFSDIFSEILSLPYINSPNFQTDDNKIYKYFNFYLKKIAFILFRPERLVYVGICFIIASFFVYFILISK